MNECWPLRAELAGTVKWGAQVRVRNKHLIDEAAAAGATDLISTSNPQTCLRLPRLAAVIPVTLKGVHMTTRIYSGHCMLRLFGVTPISPHGLLTGQTHTFQTDLLMREADGQMSSSVLSSQTGHGQDSQARGAHACHITHFEQIYLSFHF